VISLLTLLFGFSPDLKPATFWHPQLSAAADPAYDDSAIVASHHCQATLSRQACQSQESKVFGGELQEVMRSLPRFSSLQCNALATNILKPGEQGFRRGAAKSDAITISLLITTTPHSCDKHT